MMNYSKYSNVLDDECLKNYDVTNDDAEIEKVSEDKLKNLLTEHVSKTKIVISLSGGVDSMVLLHILKHFSSTEIVTVHINYNNRDESVAEADFLDAYCKHLKVKMIRHDITHIKRFQHGMNRSEYEQETKTIRYDLYKKVNDVEEVDGIYLAHHDGDVVENIFNNVMKNNHVSDLAVLKKENIINGVRILRPFIGIKKDVIMHYANKYQVPYFKDTTPDWSCRGMMRNDIFPNCKKCYGVGFDDNLLKFAEEVKEINNIAFIIMKKYMGYALLRDCILLDLKLTDEILLFPVMFWRILFDKICDDQRMPRFSKKSIDNFYNNISNENNTIMSKTTTISKYIGNVYIHTKTK